jgi:(2R)-3-sulfolactate dehydrogenase (NADP+)
VDAAGEPTTDAQSALTGMLAPLGGAKGFALALMVEALTGGLVGPALSTAVADMFDAGQAGQPQRIAHLAVAIDPSLVDPSGGSASRLEALAAGVVAAGGRLPGERRSMPEDLDPDRPLTIAPTVLDELSVWRARLIG